MSDEEKVCDAIEERGWVNELSVVSRFPGIDVFVVIRVLVQRPINVFLPRFPHATHAQWANGFNLPGNFFSILQNCPFPSRPGLGKSLDQMCVP
jgi:hypothetical protein